VIGRGLSSQVSALEEVTLESRMPGLGQVEPLTDAAAVLSAIDSSRPPRDIVVDPLRSFKNT
jgi:hypothetical protein